MPHSIGASADGICVTCVFNEQTLLTDAPTNLIVACIGILELRLNGVYDVGDEVQVGRPGSIVRLDPAMSRSPSRSRSRCRSSSPPTALLELVTIDLVRGHT
jgi:hypothetical protein